MSQEGYGATARAFLRKAHEALEAGNLLQASEKGWGAAAQMMKAVAASRGWRHDGHRELFEVTRQLVRETGDQQIAVLFHVANSLHSNFYENWMPGELVENGLDQVAELLDRVDPLVLS